MTEHPEFHWQRYPEAWQWIMSRLELSREANRDIAYLTDHLNENAGTRLIDVVDHLVVEDADNIAVRLKRYGYGIGSDGSTWRHEGAVLPPIVLGHGLNGVAIKVDSIAQYLMVRGLDLPIQGSPYSRCRRCKISAARDTVLWIVERRTTGSMEPVSEDSDYLPLYFNTLEKWLTRPRGRNDSHAAMQLALELANKQVKHAGIDMAAYLFFEAERRYWQSRSRAAAIHKKNLDAAGIGWANHDHHTYRSSRQHFHLLVTFFQTLGFQAREKFHAGKEAGWGAQVMENPAIGVVLFLDVDLSPEELDIDLERESLPDTYAAGTVGLWCALHGDSLLESGLHHLAVRSNFEKLGTVLHNDRVKLMPPFSRFPYLQQAFTRGERWQVNEERLQQLLKKEAITPEEARHFREKGAVGSHMENIQRTEGYKGFSQKQVSTIIKDTDPRHYKFA